MSARAARRPQPGGLFGGVLGGLFGGSPGRLFGVGLAALLFAAPLAAEERGEDAAAPATAAPSASAPAAAADAPSGLTWAQVALLLTACGGSGALCWQGSKKLHSMRLEPQPLEVKAHKEYVTRGEFDGYRQQVSDDFNRVHLRLDALAPAIAEIKGELKHVAQKQTQILGILMEEKVK